MVNSTKVHRTPRTRHSAGMVQLGRSIQPKPLRLEMYAIMDSKDDSLALSVSCASTTGFGEKQSSTPPTVNYGYRMVWLCIRIKRISILGTACENTTFMIPTRDKGSPNNSISSEPKLLSQQVYQPCVAGNRNARAISGIAIHSAHRLRFVGNVCTTV